jgi:uncharacterized protein YjbI with pentapeptide repeats
MTNPLIVLIAIAIGITLLVLIGGYFGHWRWTGFGSHTIETTVTEFDRTDKSTKITVSREKQPAKTLWDWTQLLIIPILIAGVTLVFSQLNAQTQLEISTDNQREAAMQAYIDKITQLLIDNKQASDMTPSARSAARTRTLAVLRQLDGKRKGLVVQFLHDSNAISTTNEYIDLNWADLHGATVDLASLDGANLSNTDLHGSDLSSAHLQGAWLIGADLKDAYMVAANLTNAKLYLADLKGANLYGANFAGAELVEANLTNAFLATAYFTGTNLSGATLSGATLTKVTWSNTQCPDRTNSDTNGGTCLNHLEEK